MQVRSGHSPGRSHTAHDSAGAHELPLLHLDLRKMGQQREDPEAVIDHDGVTAEVEIASRDDAAAVWCVDADPGRAQKVGAGVRVARLPVEDAAAAEPAVGWIWNRAQKWKVPEAFARGMGVGVGQKRRVVCDPLGHRPRRIDELRCDQQPPRWESLRQNLELVATADERSIEGPFSDQ